MTAARQIFPRASHRGRRRLRRRLGRQVAPPPTPRRPPRRTREPAARRGSAAAANTGDPEETQIWLTTGETQAGRTRPRRRRRGRRPQPRRSSRARPQKEEGGNLDAASQIPSGNESRERGGRTEGTALVEVSVRLPRRAPRRPREAHAGAEGGARCTPQSGHLHAHSIRRCRVRQGRGGGRLTGPPRDRKTSPSRQGGPPPITKGHGQADARHQRPSRSGSSKLSYLPKGAVDGLNGYRTQQAVIAFQSWGGLARDGIVGPQTKAGAGQRQAPTGQRPARRPESRSIARRGWR